VENSYLRIQWADVLFHGWKYHVTFGFLRGTSLPDPAGLLQRIGKNGRRLNKKEPMEKVMKSKK